jgi:hypothetical protein
MFNLATLAAFMTKLTPSDTDLLTHRAVYTKVILKGIEHSTGNFFIAVKGQNLKSYNRFFFSNFQPIFF